MSIPGTKPSLLGRRVHIAGSANPQTDVQYIRYAHELIARVTHGILQAGGGLVVGVGKEPRVEGAQSDTPSLVFDWTALEAAADCLRGGSYAWPAESGAPLVVVTSEKAESEIPQQRRLLWNYLLGSQAVRLEFIQPGARSGAMIRERQVQFGDILWILGGGTGVEHLADMYMGRRRPILPMDLPLGASRVDGTGGSERLYREARSNLHQFFRLPAPIAETANTRLTSLATQNGTVDVVHVAGNVVALMLDLAPPKAFYVRLLNPKHEAFTRVEAFFRHVVDPVVTAAGFERAEMGTDTTEHAFINVGIFDALHFASVSVVDITGERPNCFIELGYALRGQRVIITAEEGTQLPFDQNAIPCHFWKKNLHNQKRQELLAEFWRRNVDRPPLVRP